MNLALNEDNFSMAPASLQYMFMYLHPSKLMNHISGDLDKLKDLNNKNHNKF